MKTWEIIEVFKKESRGAGRGSVAEETSFLEEIRLKNPHKIAQGYREPGALARPRPPGGGR